MSHDIREPDWKLLRSLKQVALERFCERVLSEIQYVASDSEQTSLERYRAVFRVIHDRDEELAIAFDNLKRSNGLMKLARMRSFSLVTDLEFAQFSAECQEVVLSFVERWQET